MDPWYLDRLYWGVVRLPVFQVEGSIFFSEEIVLKAHIEVLKGLVPVVLVLVRQGCGRGVLVEEGSIQELRALISESKQE